MLSRVYAIRTRAGSMKLSGLSLSVRPSRAARRCGGFAAVCPAGRRQRSIATLPALSSKCEHYHADSWRSKLNTDLLGRVHSAWTELNWPATSRPSYTTRSLVALISVTIWLAAAKLGRLVLSQFVRCEHSHRSTMRSELEFSSVSFTA